MSRTRPTRPAGAARPAGAVAGGAGLGVLGVLAFSFSLPATKLAVADLDPWLVAFGRAAVAGVLSIAVLLAVRAPLPSAGQWRSLLVVAAGVVAGFPLLSSLALRDLPSAHGAVVIGVLPATTAAIAVLRAGERPSARFWLASAAGMAAVVAFAATRGTGGLATADLELLLGVVLCAAGYAEGGRLSRDLGGARTICWALVLSLPFSLAASAATITAAGAHGRATAWLGFAYVSVFSMFLGFFAWYAGLARGGVAKIGQIQLGQPVLTLAWSWLVLGETVAGATVPAAVAVLACVAATQRARVS